MNRSIFLPEFISLREMRRPWKLVTFALGMTSLIYGARFYRICDWDVGISLIMGGFAYAFAPWSVLVLHQALRYRNPGWFLQAIAAFLPAMFTVDLIYWLYHTAFGNQMLRWENFKVSMALYFICGIGWGYRGSLKDFFREVADNSTS
jgi:hypothetical protein